MKRETNLHLIEELTSHEPRIAVIPARGGSKRIPRKNIRLFAGKPIIAFAIEAALSSSIFDSVHVSTDDEEIATISQAFGARVDSLRKMNISDDFTPTLPVIQAFIQEQELPEDANVCCIYPANPFLQTDNLILGYQLLMEQPIANYVCPVVRYRYPPQRSLKTLKNGLLEMVEMENLQVRSQVLEERLHDAGQFYWGKAHTWSRGIPMLTGTKGIVIDQWDAVDIDNEEDWEYAELIYSSLKS